MKFIPILFSTPMVQAILDGRKTMTRRVVCKDSHINNPDMVLCDITNDGVFAHFGLSPTGNPEAGYVSKYKTGDVLWVRETHYAYGYWSTIVDSEKLKIEWRFHDVTLDFVFGPDEKKYLYEENRPKEVLKRNSGKMGWYKRPSIHMPKSACRIFLQVKSVRPERLQDISKEDAIAEGIGRWVEERWTSKPTHYQVYFQEDPKDPATYTSSAIDSFETLWKSINGPQSWDGNPWVWVVEFKRIEKPENFLD